MSQTIFKISKYRLVLILITLLIFAFIMKAGFTVYIAIALWSFLIICLEYQNQKSAQMDPKTGVLNVQKNTLVFFSNDGSHVSLLNNLDVGNKIFKVFKENEFRDDSHKMGLPRYLNSPTTELVGVSSAKFGVPKKGVYEFINLPVIWDSIRFPQQLNNLKAIIDRQCARRYYGNRYIMTLDAGNLKNTRSRNFENLNNIIRCVQEDDIPEYILILTGCTSESATLNQFKMFEKFFQHLPAAVLCISFESSQKDMIRKILKAVESF